MLVNILVEKINYILKMSKKNRNKLVQDLNALGRKMSTSAVIFHQAIAEKAGLSGADHKYLDLLFQEGPMTAGRLAELTGLTTGAVTGLIDRLEKDGMVKRENDPHDRRKVLVVPEVEVAKKKISPAFMEMQEGLNELYEKFTENDLEVIKRYLEDSVNFFFEQTKRLKERKKK